MAAHRMGQFILTSSKTAASAVIVAPIVSAGKSDIDYNRIELNIVKSAENVWRGYVRSLIIEVMNYLFLGELAGARSRNKTEQ